MSVYTHLSQDQFTEFCQAFGVNFAKAIPITQGIKNSNWFIQTTEDALSGVENSYSYVFTLFEERPPEDIAKMATILNKLSGKLPVAAPLAIKSSATEANQDGSAEYLIHFEGKAITLVPCLAGTHPTKTTPSMCRTMGQALAVLHNSLQSLTPAEDYGVPLYPWDQVRDREIQFMPGDEAKLMRDIWQGYDELPLDSLPQGLCHLDMFADNTLWDLAGGRETLTGLLDFTEVSAEHYVMDIAITINDFCTTWGDAEDGETVNFDTAKMQAFLDGYNSERPLTEAEQHALPVMLSMAAVTFWLLRLNVIYYNREQGRTGDNIMVKNPDLMKRLAAYHWGRVEKLRGLKSTVFVLEHVSRKDTNSDTYNNDMKLIGVFATESQAQAAVEQLKSQPGFKDYPDGFHIDAYPLGQINWQTGFGG